MVSGQYGPMTIATRDALLDSLGVTQDQAIQWTSTHLEGLRLLLATIAFLVWDYLITLPAEVEYIWKKNPWTVTKVLFIINRYFPIVHCIARFWAYTNERNPKLSSIACGPVLDISAYGSIISVAVVEVVLMLRLWAIYGREKPFGFFLVFVFLVGFGIALAIRKVQPPDSFKLVVEPPLSLTICVRSSPSELFLLYMIVLIVETMTFFLLLRAVWIVSSTGLAPILKMMLNHGTQYYLIVFVALFLQVLGTIFQPLWQPMADSLLVVPVTSVACNRLILSLRGIYTKTEHVATMTTFRVRSGEDENNTDGVPLGALHNRALAYETLPSFRAAPSSSRQFSEISSPTTAFSNESRNFLEHSSPKSPERRMSRNRL